MSTSKIKIYSRLNPPTLVKIKVGSPIFLKYGAKLDEKTNKVVVRVIEKYDITEQIQSYRKDTDIYYLLSKFKNGDVSAFTGAKSVLYEDLSEVPNSLIDMTDLLQRGEGIFNNLNPEFKNKYNLNSLKDFLNLMFTGELFDKTKKVDEKKEEVKKENIKENIKDDTQDNNK